MANNFFNKMVRNVSADETAPSLVYAPAASTKTIVIELDVANRSTSSQTISVLIDDFSAKGANVVSTAAAIANDIIVTATHSLTTGDRIRLTNAGNSTILYNSAALSETTVWYAIVISATSFKLATSHANATAGTNVDLTGAQTKWQIIFSTKQIGMSLRIILCRHMFILFLQVKRQL